MVAGASLVEIDSDVGLIGDVAECDRPHTGDPFDQAKAAQWARGRAPGLYSMLDVLGLKD